MNIMLLFPTEPAWPRYSENQRSIALRWGDCLTFDVDLGFLRNQNGIALYKEIH